MKLILISITTLLIFATPVFSELTVEDLEKIRSIVKESEDRLKGDLKASEEHLKGDLEKTHSSIKASEERLMKHVDDKFSEMDKRLNMLSGFVIALISLIVIVVGIPQVLMVWRGKEERTQKEQIQELKHEIEALKQHIASL